MRGSFRIGKIAGIEIGIHYTWIFAFGLICLVIWRSHFSSGLSGMVHGLILDSRDNCFAGDICFGVNS